MMIPNILYALRHRSVESRGTSRRFNIAEQIGRCSCMFLMVFNVGVAELDFASVATFLIYLISSVVLLLSYIALWIVYGKRQSLFVALTLAILPTLLFLLSGLTIQHWLLMGFSMLSGAAHIYITAVNVWETA